ncbi:MAG: NHLP family bacteriocin export ABC transporter peptidase/permease/ATPase subunit [Erythrobacter sp.]|nr:NHLP family bacteriocin export ABC transporter peptidase/permease/ATPase subunit [Erythrobacter sp.]
MTVARTPTILQMEAAECGAASLGMVLAYHGRFIPLEELRALCGVSRDGAKASSLVKAGRALGMEAVGMKAEPEALEEIGFPLIAFVNFNHFVVIEGFRKDRVLINDPAHGHRSESQEEFSRSFTGVALGFTPGPDFERRDDRPSVFASLRARIAPFRQALLYVFLASLALVVPGILVPFFGQIFVDYVLVRGLDGWLWPLLGGMAATALLRLLLMVPQQVMLARLGGAMRLRSGQDLFAHMLRLPIAFFEQRFTGEIADRIRLNEGLAQLLSGQLIGAAINLLLAAFYLVVLLLFSMWLTMGVVLLAVANALALVLSTRLVSEKFRKLSLDQGKMAGARISGLKDIETFKASGSEAMLFTRWTGLKASALNATQEVAAVRAWTQPIPALITSLVVLLTLVGGGWLVMRGQFTLGQMVAYQSLAMAFAAPVTALAGFGAELQQLRTFLNRLDDTLEQAPDPAMVPREGPYPDGLPGGAVDLVEASFGYNPLDPPLIDRLSLSIAPGRRVALVGASGSGKSTVGKMIGGLVPLRDGAVLVGGRAREDWPRDMLAARLAYVRQDIALFAGTVRDNLTLWDSSIEDDALLRAARDAAIDQAIASWPGGLDAVLAPGATNISGGERQRLEIARALASDPAIIILDEATSALDPVTEQRVMEAIRRRGLTAIVIAHRLSTIRDCDEIVVLDRGQVVERGTHGALMASGGSYARLVEA